ncbi:MAG: hypothetical protein Q9195_002159 [Heterodermia aff. obscurata]
MLLSSADCFTLLLFCFTNPISALNTVNIPPNISLPTNSSHDYTNASCTSLLTHANATASRSFQSPLLGGFTELGSSPNETFLLTAAVNEAVNNATNATGIDTTIWFGVHQDRNLPQDGLAFAGCAIIIDALPLDSIKRGQADNGTCAQTFSESCTKALINRTAAISADWAGYGVGLGDQKYMYLDICSNIALQLSDKDHVPDECKEFRDAGSETLWFNYEVEPITGSQDAPAYQTCSVIDSPAPYIQYPLYNKLSDINNLEDAYDNATQAVIPVFIVEMPAFTGTVVQQGSEANLVCLHPSNISSGSETPPALPPADSAALGRNGGRRAGLALLGVAMLMAM